MAATGMPTATRIALAIAAVLASVSGAAAAEDALKIAIGQRGGWEQCVSELGQNHGIFKRHGLALDLLYTQGSGETLQSVISASVDIGIGTGTHALLGAYAKGAPVRAIGSSFTSADDQFYYVAADSTLHDMKEADGRTIAISTTGSQGYNQFWPSCDTVWKSCVLTRGSVRYTGSVSTTMWVM